MSGAAACTASASSSDVRRCPVLLSLAYSYHAEFSLCSPLFFLFLTAITLTSLRMQWSLRDNSVSLSLGFEYRRYVTLRYRLFKMLEYLKKNKIKKHERRGDSWRGLMGLRALLEWCLISLLCKCCQWFLEESGGLHLSRERAPAKAEAGVGGTHGGRTVPRPPLTPHTRSWVVLGAVTSHVSRRALKPQTPSCTCRTWPPCWRAAQLSGIDPRSRGWWGAPSPEEHSRVTRMPLGSGCCTGSAASEEKAKIGDGDQQQLQIDSWL